VMAESIQAPELDQFIQFSCTSCVLLCWVQAVCL
jgi:hypothetical protein